MKHLDRLLALAKTGTRVGEEPAKPAKAPFAAFAATPAPLPPNSSASSGAAAARDTADLLALVERVARAYRTPPDELQTIKRLALADPDAAWSAFMATARTDGIH